MERTRAEDILDTYGADPARWPAAERDGVRALVGDDLPLRRRAERAAELDAALGIWARGGPDDNALVARLSADAALHRAAGRHRPHLLRWAGGGAIAAAVALAALLSPALSDKPVALPAAPAARTAAVQTASADDSIDRHLWSMTFTPTPDEESSI